MKYIKKIDEAFLPPMRPKKPKQDIKGEDIQDIHHWVVEIKNSVPYLRISTDDDIYYVELSNLNKIKSDLNLTDND